MRQKIIPGVVLVVAMALVVVVSALLDLELESVALMGVTIGAVVALVPDRTPLVRLGGFAAGVLVAWLGYLVRAALLPDTSAGRGVAFALIVLVAVAIAAAVTKVPLWSVLLGIAGVAGAYELTFAAAPTEVVSTSITMLTSLLLTVAAGFVACVAFASPRADAVETTPRDAVPTPERNDHVSHDARIDDLLEPTK